MSYVYLQHHGIKGQKWGVRRFQNADGTLTSVGKKRYDKKWATSEHQPSSIKSSVLAGLYAATGNKRVGKALDKSNDKDAERWNKAKEQYNESGKKAVSKIIDKAKDKTVSKWKEENAASKEKMREQIVNGLFGPINEQSFNDLRGNSALKELFVIPKQEQPWNEKPSNRKDGYPMDEKPRKKKPGTYNI